ncbi:hypothetical protein Pla22_28080 [Rubripirellula amarantea]|uniref:Uncharacterized protein n=1 Tax=Rubripirellula amarantea TaxID=2527999 RepID=A0A5C5WW26_9BACT|nr:hypothetical protein Pla22_28080 [Rubripirellula amarantea]
MICASKPLMLIFAFTLAAVSRADCCAAIVSFDLQNANP